MTPREALTLLPGDCRQILPTLPAQSVQAVITSPPYWGLRSYTAADAPEKANELGGEDCHDCLGWATGTACGACWICHMLAVFTAVHRVLRNDGVCLVNLGDSYIGNASSGGKGHGTESTPFRITHAIRKKGLREKSLCLMPQRFALAMQAHGWIVRQWWPWLKVNALPESVQDRPTTALETWWMLVKQPRYFCDMEAVRQQAIYEGDTRHLRTDISKMPGGPRVDNGSRQSTGTPTHGRNFRTTDLWYQSLHSPYGLVGEGDSILGQDTPTMGFKGHYATFSEKLITPLLQMVVSAKGACAACGAPWARDITRTPDHSRGEGLTPKGNHQEDRANFRTNPPSSIHTTTGWRQTCHCAEQTTVPCTVLDPFAGAGTVLAVAQRLGLRAIGIELVPANIALIQARLTQPALPLTL